MCVIITIGLFKFLMFECLTEPDPNNNRFNQVVLINLSEAGRYSLIGFL